MKMALWAIMTLWRRLRSAGCALRLGMQGMEAWGEHQATCSPAQVDASVRN